jgi:hypothetical protein
MSNYHENKQEHNNSKLTKTLSHKAQNLSRPVMSHRCDVMRTVKLEQRVTDLENEIAALRKMISSVNDGRIE